VADERRTVRLERTGDGVALITLDRPHVHNSLNTAMADELLVLAAELADDESVPSVVVTGAGGRAFCAGADIAEFGSLATPDDFHAFVQRLGAAVEAIAALPQIVVAAVEGIAFGGGCELAMACDLRTVSERSRFALPEIKLGLLPGLGGTQRAARMLPMSVATRLLVTGEPLDAHDAHRFGFCEEPVAAGGALAAALDVARAISFGPAAALVQAKRLLRDGPTMSLADAIVLEQEAGRHLFGTADAREGVTAFLEKRSPQFGTAPTHHHGGRPFS
jgi:enoyl-CoA hydratase